MNDTTLHDPIVLVHGIFGFDRLSLPGVEVEYFRGIRDALREAGNTLPDRFPLLPLAGSVEERARALAQYLDDDPAVQGRPVHVIAHSQGGLDARRMISQRSDIAGRVRTLTTIGTPHNGTPLASLGGVELTPVFEALRRLGIDIRGLLDLTPQACADFNRQNPDAPNVRYFSVAGSYSPGPLDLLKVSHRILVAGGASVNDGLIPLESARHGQFLGSWEANHFRLINWATNILLPLEELKNVDILVRYRRLVQSLATAIAVPDAWKT